ncbi:MAG: phenylalanine--tRNA ligase subunit beta [Chromatiales bacterium]|nr:phenylalanine--tRNA ligase subunit beta [Chromatiales bacterium]
MRCNLEWLKQWLPVGLDTENLSEHLTMVGLEVDAVEQVCHPLSGVVVGRIVSVAQHPNATGLKLCRVDSGDGQLHQVVCGASNVRSEMLVAYAPPGAHIDGTDVLVKNIRGYDSEGMLCSAYELGIAEEQEGLLELDSNADLGQSLVDYMSLDDLVYDIDLTPNRADCLSILGIARELSVIFQQLITPLPRFSPPPMHENAPEVQLLQPDACPLYLAKQIQQLDLRKTTPLWMKERLRRCGIRVIHPVVDILNYVMLESGQPMHAFDRTAVKGALCIRWADATEQLKVLGGQNVKLDSRTLVIADAQSVLAIAGIIGGEHSAVKENSTDIILESAFFNPQAILGRARHYRLQTESSHRFERGVDFDLQHQAIEYATDLITEILGGEAGPTVEVTDVEHLPTRAPITLNKQTVLACLGVSLSPNFIERTLTDLGCQVEAGAGNWQCTPPSYRFDLMIAEDLIEELARIYGYDRIPEKIASHSSHFSIDSVKQNLLHWSEYLTAHGYFEVITYSFISVEQLLAFTPDADIEMLKLTNPVSVEMSVMRTSLWPGLLQILKYNLNRQQDKVCIFEQGAEFYFNENKIEQRKVLAGLVYGAVMPNQWAAKDRRYDFYDVKGDIENLLHTFEHQLRFKASEHCGLHAGLCADIYIADKYVGRMGALAPSLATQYKLPEQVFLFELQVDLLEDAQLPHYQTISTYPSVRRDLALVVARTIGVSELLEYIDSLHIKYLESRFIFDVFEDQQLGEAVKNIGIGFVFRDSEKTLQKDTVDELMQILVERITGKFAAQLRL